MYVCLCVRASVCSQAKIFSARFAVHFLTFSCVSFIHSFFSFIYFDSGSISHKDNRQITIDNKRKTKVHNNRHIVDKWKWTDRDN